MKSHVIALSGLVLTVIAGSVHAQQTFAAGGLTATTAVQGLSLGNATSAANTFLIATDWSAIAGNPFSNEARFALNGDPSGSGTVYRGTSSFANGAGANANTSTLFSFGTLSAPVPAGAPVALRYNQTFTGSSASWANTRVVLNPTINDNATRAGLGVPTNFTDLGTFAIGATSLSVNAANTTIGATGRNWYRFSVNTNVSSSLGNALDIFGNNAGDSGLVVFRQTANGLIPVAEGDDIAGAANRNAGVSFGSADATSNHRTTYAPVGNATYFRGQGGDRGAVNGYQNGFYSGVAGAATLLAGETYFIGYSNFSPYLAGTLTGGGASLGLDGTSVNVTGAYALNWGNPGTALGSAATREIRS
ncbi:MAG: hypothetical protein ACOYN0_17905, partial [Phycisphaerales bacterium]